MKSRITTSRARINPFFTIGHSTRSLQEFVSLLKPFEIGLVVDVRSIPRSRTNPQFNSTEFSAALLEYQIRYEHIEALGGLRGRKSTVSPDVNALWKHQSFHNYADYALSDEFRVGLSRLRELGHATPCVIMCAEAVWWRCHRRIITDYLLASGETVRHILDPGHIDTAQITKGAHVGRDGSMFYPAMRASSSSRKPADKG